MNNKKKIPLHALGYEMIVGCMKCKTLIRIKAKPKEDQSDYEVCAERINPTIENCLACRVIGIDLTKRIKRNLRFIDRELHKLETFKFQPLE